MTEPNRAQALMDEFKTGLEKDGPIVLAQRVAELEDQNAALIAAQTGLDEDIERERKRADAAEARATKAEAGETKAKGQVKKLTTPAKPRKLGAIDGERFSIEELRELIDDGDEVSIAFSDGTREVAGIAPVAVSGDAWSETATGLMLAKKVDIDGPGDSGTSVTIDGYALMIDGKQVAYSRRSTPIQIAPGQRVQIVDDIIF